MCLACLEYNKGNLTLDEFKKNIKEFANEKHDPKAMDDLPEEINSQELWPDYPSQLDFIEWPTND